MDLSCLPFRPASTHSWFRTHFDSASPLRAFSVFHRYSPRQYTIACILIPRTSFLSLSHARPPLPLPRHIYILLVYLYIPAPGLLSVQRLNIITSQTFIPLPVVRHPLSYCASKRAVAPALSALDSDAIPPY